MRRGGGTGRGGRKIPSARASSDFDHIHENNISFWGKWRGPNLLRGVLLRVEHDNRSNTRTIKSVEYLERQKDGTYLNVNNNTRSRDLAQAAADQAFFSHAISERKQDSAEQKEYKRRKKRHGPARTYTFNLYQPVLISSRLSPWKCWELARVSSITPGVCIVPQMSVKV